MASEVVIRLSQDYHKTIFNALILIGGLLEHITNRLIDLVAIDRIEELEIEHFDRVFDAFVVQTQVGYY